MNGPSQNENEKQRIVKRELTKTYCGFENKAWKHHLKWIGKFFRKTNKNQLKISVPKKQEAKIEHKLFYKKSEIKILNYGYFTIFQISELGLIKF